MRKILFLFTVQTLLALTSKDFIDFNSLETGPGLGYRHDSLEWTYTNINGLPDAKYKYKDLQSVAMDFSGRLFLWNFMVRGGFDYAWIQSGKLDLFIAADSTVDSPSTPAAYLSPFDFQITEVRGNLFDWNLGGGYAIPFYKKFSNWLYLIPEAGYSFSSQTLSHGDASGPVTLPATVFGLSLMTNRVTGVDRTRRWWKGPYVGGDLYGKYKKFSVDLAYYYHFLQMEQKNRLFLETSLYLFPVPGLIQQVIIDASTIGSPKNLHGSEFFGRIGYEIGSCFKLALSGKYFTTSFGGKRADLSQDQSVSGTTQHVSYVFGFDGNWRTYSILLEGMIFF